MREMESDPTALERKCREAAALLIARHRWQLLDLDTFARRVATHVRATATDPYQSATHVYSHVLHAACAGGAGDQQQNLGYTELFRYLYSIARHRYADVCDEATQIALERTFIAFDRCREPGAFLAFALQRLMDAARSLRHQVSTSTQSLASPVGEDGDTLGELLPDQQQPDPAEAVLRADLRERFEQLIASFLQQHPRAVQQIEALRLKYIEGLDDQAISQRLGKPVASIYLLRHRAVEKLRADAAWRALGVELGLLPEE